MKDGDKTIKIEDCFFMCRELLKHSFPYSIITKQYTQQQSKMVRTSSFTQFSGMVYAGFGCALRPTTGMKRASRKTAF